MYKLDYLPLAKKDMVEIVQYISHKLGNPVAALRLAQDFISAGERLTTFPYASPVYLPIRTLQHEYRTARVRNYLMFYWVDEVDKCIVIARVLYAKRDHDTLLN